MPTEQEVASASRALAVGLSMIAAFLGLSQWYDRRARDDATDPEDVRHYASQDRRRWTGVAALATISLAALAASFSTSRKWVTVANGMVTSVRAPVLKAPAWPHENPWRPYSTFQPRP